MIFATDNLSSMPEIARVLHLWMVHAITMNAGHATFQELVASPSKLRSFDRIPPRIRLCRLADIASISEVVSTEYGTFYQHENIHSRISTILNHID